MPLLVKDFTWSQTQTTLHVIVPLQSKNHEKVDIFMFNDYVKVHFKPFLLELFLLHEIDHNKSKALITDVAINLDFEKRENLEWECLEKELTKPEKMKIKQEILEKSLEEAKQEAEDRRIKKTEMDRFTVSQAMIIDERQHKLMDSRRDAERKKAMDALEDWRVTKENTPDGKNKETNKVTHYKSGVKVVELSSSYDESKNSKTVRNLATKKSIPSKTAVKSEYVDKKKQEVANRVLPRLRSAGEVEIQHTPRTFPTPSRESMAKEEEAWLKNLTLARRATGFVSEDLRPEEQDPEWCKVKGDEFFRNSNFLGAISAYSHGIKLSDKLPSLYANRSAAHFALGNFNKCVNDCSTALDLLKPACEGNRKSRAKNIARRAAALARLGYLSKAIDEMKAASKLLPEDDKIKQDIYDMERAWEQNPDSD